MLHRLVNTIQPYAWGSPSALTELYGITEPDGGPMAELWMGAHPKAPSRLEIDGEAVGLDEYIAANPERALGPAAAEFGERLPFLFKILCAEAPLSIQAHPTLEQAITGFEAEEDAGIDIGSPERNYRDPNHKPELICAIRPFWGLRGFRPIEEIERDLSEDEFRQSDAEIALPAGEDDLSRFFRQLLELPPDEQRELIAAAIAFATRALRGRSSDVPEPDDPLARLIWVLRIADEHPGDIGILAPLLLNVFALRPGEATYQPAGVLHAYLHGVGAELMANSDNVLRGGMTVKHIDVDELLRVGRFAVEPPVVLTGASAHERPAWREADGVGRPTDGCRVVRYEAPFDEFAFARALPDGECALPGGSAQILFCHAGPVTLLADGGEVRLEPGESAFVDAASDSVAIRGAGELFRAAVPGTS